MEPIDDGDETKYMLTKDELNALYESEQRACNRGLVLIPWLLFSLWGAVVGFILGVVLS